MKKILFPLALFFITYCYTQSKPFFKDYSWENQPNYSVEPTKGESLISIKETKVTEFFYLEDKLVEYYLDHKVIWVNSDDAIEDFNKIYLPYSSTSIIEIAKARVITKEGKILELNESHILTAQDEKTKSQYKYFAFEGVELGSFIEYYYVVKKNPKYKGKRLTLQSSFRKFNIDVNVIAPKNLVFEFKSYNGLAEMSKDTLKKEKNHWGLHIEELVKLEKENFAAYTASKQYLVYKLDGNTATNSNEISSYANSSQNLYAFYYPEYSKKTISLIETFLKESDCIEEGASQEATIRKLESYLKTNVFISKTNANELKDLNIVLEKKIGNETGVLKLYVALLRYLKVKHELVITSDRQKIKFDNKFDANCFLTDFLFYFPKNKTYLSPFEMDSRYGFPPGYFTDNYGLFIKEVAIGDYKSGIGKVKYIKPISAKKNFDIKRIHVSFDKDYFNICNVSLNESMGGYYAMYIQPFINLISEEDKEEMLEGFGKSINKDVRIVDKSFKSADPTMFGIEPFEITVDFTSDDFVEKAGRKYLFKLGQLIGPQMEMYQEKERILPIENEFERRYESIITVKIPEGYEFANLKEIEIVNSHSVNDNPVFLFNSSYKIEDGILTVNLEEYYKSNIIAKETYEAYRKVINSAADFNKIVLVLQPMK